MLRSTLLIAIIIVLIKLHGENGVVNCQVVDLEKHDFSEPQPFQENFLASSKLPPSDEGKSFKNLGKITRLSKVFRPKEIATKFSIYNRIGSLEDIKYNPKKDSKHGGVYHFNLRDIYLSGFNPKLRTIIMIPGYMTDDRPDWVLQSKDLWLKLRDVNVIMVTWKDGNRPFYHGAIANIPIVARQISIFLYYLADLNGFGVNDSDFLNRIEIVGHSLGAHIAGFVGKDFGGQLGRIVGLDPAGPHFHKMPRSKRLDRQDAKLVTVFHSNGGSMNYLRFGEDGVKSFLSKKIDDAKESFDDDELADENHSDVPTHFGIDQQLGDVDYFLNDGKEQPGCEDITYGCDHSRCAKVYISILEYELTLLRVSQINGEDVSDDDDDDWLKKNRLLAIQSEDYKDFASGLSLADEKCSSNILSSLSRYVQNTTKSFNNNCAIPIDVINSADKVRNELKTIFKVDFDKSNNINGSSRYWLKTLPTKPFVGKHYMMKIEFERNASSWSETCGLVAQATMANGYNVTLDIRRESDLIDNEKFYGLAMPFINPSGAGAVSALKSIKVNLKPQDRDNNIDIKSLTKVLPIRIKLIISSDKSDKPLNAGQESTNSFEKGNTCKLVLKSTAVEPIGLLDQLDLIGSYKRPEQNLRGAGRNRGRNVRTIQDQEVLNLQAIKIHVYTLLIINLS